jgi:glycosyltransferase involved in cell wall biosynthesis
MAADNISLIIPVYKNSQNIAPLLTALESLHIQLPNFLEVVFVVDGSPDDSLPQLRKALPTCSFRSQLLGLSRNFGSFAAIRAGLSAGEGPLYAVMAADLQEPPDLIVGFHDALITGEVDVVFGNRVSRQDPVLSRLSSHLFWGLYRRLIIRDMPAGGVDVFGSTREVRDQIINLKENHSSLVGLLFWVGFRRQFVPYSRLRREIGRSSWTLSKKLNYLIDSVFGFSDLPIRLLSILGLAGMLFSIGLAGTVTAAKVLQEIPVPGYAATVIAVSFFGGLNCFGLGIIGGYVWRTYENTKARPNYIVAYRHTNLEENAR